MEFLDSNRSIPNDCPSLYDEMVSMVERADHHPDIRVDPVQWETMHKSLQSK